MKNLGAIRFLAAAGVALLCLAFAAPSQAQYNYYGSSYSPGYGYTPGSGGSSFSSVTSSISNWVNSTFGDGQGQGIGRTLGGAAGIAAGSFGGAALASAVIKSAGVASMGPIAPILVGTAITAGGAFLGAKILSKGGDWMDNALGPDMTWTLVGATAGAVAGFALLPALGPFAGPAGRVLGAAIGGVAGGILGKIFAPTLQRFATTKTIYGATGAILGGAGFGIPGALIGAVGGYALGSIFNQNFFTTPGQSLGSQLSQSTQLTQPYYGLKNAASTIGNYVNNTSYDASNALQGPGNYYNPYGQSYYSGGYAYAPSSTPAAPPNSGGDATGGDAATIARNQSDAYNKMLSAQASGNTGQFLQYKQQYDGYTTQLQQLRANGGQ